ncbi:MAG TPA: TolC family outer membrane protein [Hydrogenophaga sp.]|uniref:TolC family outer membrane protein n=1 Tax=Hydrogenophaga sp. TaxID=1904254 RepID=UPI002C50374E|nr:TolC family outer membrane protein [Hydrogenophaga sp.]HMN93082.1 TolC family outer membrane protein [Hydrogenophaga sp.]HMP11679.1 TolC family outer membrane protein [Hydrogenophaga sp.]
MAWSWGTAAQAQSLLELYGAARDYDSTLTAARLQHEANLARAAQARAGLLPQAGLSAGANWANVDSSALPGTRTSNSQNVALSASQPLYRPANRIGNEQAALSIEASEAQLTLAEQDLVVRLSQAYFDVLAAQDTVTFIEAQKAAVSEQLAAARRNFEVGTSTITDTREAQARFDLVSAQEIAARNDLRVKKLALDQLVGRADTAPLPLALPVTIPAVQPESPDAWVARAVEGHPALLAAGRARDIAQLETRKAEAGHRPTLDLVGQYQISRGPSSMAPGQVRNNTASVGLQFNLPLFAGYAIQNRVKETLALEEKAGAELESTSRNIAQATRAAYFGVLSGIGQVRALEAAEASSQSALEANQLGYQVGVRINIDVLNAQSQLFQTKRDLAQARYNVLVGQLRLKQASGQLSAEDLKPVDALLAR